MCTSNPHHPFQFSNSLGYDESAEGKAPSSETFSRYELKILDLSPTSFDLTSRSPPPFEGRRNAVLVACNSILNIGFVDVQSHLVD
jgi:hypothetical protein